MGRGGSLSSGTCWQAATKIHTNTQAWLGGRSFSLTHSESLRVEDSSSIPFPPVPPGPPWRPATYVLAGPVGGMARQLQTVRAKRQVYSRVYSAEGGGRGQGGHTPCQGPIPMPVPTFLPHPPFPALGQSRPRPQGPVAGTSFNTHAREVREPSSRRQEAPEQA